MTEEKYSEIATLTAEMIKEFLESETIIL